MTPALNPSSDPKDAPLRVLLISPVRGVDPLSGDVTYTEQLMSSPPPGIQYFTYVEALQDGTLVECGTREAVVAARGPQRLRQLAFALWRKAEYAVRRTGLVYREPLRLFSVDSAAYDLVHVHVFHHRFLGPRPPVLMSAAGPLEWVYGDAWHWPRWRRSIAEAFDRLVGSLWDASICGLRMGRDDRFVVFSDYFKSWLTERGWPAELIDVVPNQLDFAPADKPWTGAPRRLGFIAKDFEAKGGEVLLTAFERLRAGHPELELVIVGSPPRLSEQTLAERSITWLPFVPRDELLRDVIPTIDVLVYPSLFDGLPYGPMEALATGIPCVVSDYRALPEMVTPAGGRVSRTGDPDSVVRAVEELLDPEVWREASAAARHQFHTRFSAATQSPRLGTSYQLAADEQERTRLR